MRRSVRDSHSMTSSSRNSSKGLLTPWPWHNACGATTDTRTSRTAHFAFRPLFDVPEQRMCAVAAPEVHSDDEFEPRTNHPARRGILGAENAPQRDRAGRI